MLARVCAGVINDTLMSSTKMFSSVRPRSFLKDICLMPACMSPLASDLHFPASIRQVGGSGRRDRQTVTPHIQFEFAALRCAVQRVVSFFQSRKPPRMIFVVQAFGAQQQMKIQQRAVKLREPAVFCGRRSQSFDC